MNAERGGAAASAKLNGIKCALFVLCALFWALLFFLPMPKVSAVSEESYLCLWADGEETRENYFAAYADMVGMNDVGEVILERDGRQGSIPAGEACSAAFSTLEGGGLAELLQLKISGVSRLERAALYRRYQTRLWYADEFFAWNGEAIERAAARRAESLVFLAGSMTATRLTETQATRLYLRAAAEFDADVLTGTAVKEVVAEPPYFSEGNAVCLSTAGGVRLLAGIPTAKSVTVSEDVSFADEGALLPCTALEEVTIPFVGNVRSSQGTLYRGEFAYLFSTGKEFCVPASLKRVRVTGGYLSPYAFYVCKNIEEIDACGIPAQDVEKDAFAGCVSLKLLHTSRADVTLQGNFTKRLAPCGCTIYERAD